jgi:hypothetical protein
MDLPKRQTRQKNNIRFQMPDLPPEMWCDFRIDLAEKHMTLTELAAKYSCDPRTVRACIQCNKSSSELGKQSVPTKIQIYESHIRNLLLHMKTVPDDICTIYSLSRYLYPLLQQQGYTGSERTLRNHLSSQPYIKAFLEKNKYFENFPQGNVCVEKEDLCYISKTPKI